MGGVVLRTRLAGGALTAHGPLRGNFIELLGLSQGLRPLIEAP